MADLFSPTIPELIACAEREVKMRERVYPARVAAGRMTQDKADRELAMMREIVAVLKAVDAGRPHGREPDGDILPGCPHGTEAEQGWCAQCEAGLPGFDGTRPRGVEAD